MDGRSLDMVSPDTARDFIHVDDVVAAYLQVGQLNLQCGEVFNIGTGIQSTMREVVKAVMNSTHSTPKVSWGSMPARNWDSETWFADISKIRRVLKWAPRIGLAQGIEKTTAFFREEERRAMQANEGSPLQAVA
jgi:nucleoside-diphosphate-sugar epimerase